MYYNDGQKGSELHYIGRRLGLNSYNFIFADVADRTLLLQPSHLQTMATHGCPWTGQTLSESTRMPFSQHQPRCSTQ